jgi:hypothetical protein
VDEHGEEVDGDTIMAICGRRMLERNELKKQTVVATVMSNLGLERSLAQLGGRLERVQVGDRAVLRDELLKVGLDTRLGVEAPPERGERKAGRDDAAGMSRRRPQGAAAGGGGQLVHGQAGEAVPALLLADLPGGGEGRQGPLFGNRWWWHEIILDEISRLV